jgi:hypothetical protein
VASTEGEDLVIAHVAALALAVRPSTYFPVLRPAAIRRQIDAALSHALELYFDRCRRPVPVRCLLPTLCAIGALPARPHC